MRSWRALPDLKYRVTHAGEQVGADDLDHREPAGARSVRLFSTWHLRQRDPGLLAGLLDHPAAMDHDGAEPDFGEGFQVAVAEEPPQLDHLDRGRHGAAPS